MEENVTQKPIEEIEIPTNREIPEIQENELTKKKKKIKKSIIRRPSKITIIIAKFKEKHKEKLEFIKRFALYSIAYGIPINYMLWSIFSVPFVPWGFPAYGVFWYILSEELPPIKNKFFPPKR